MANDRRAAVVGELLKRAGITGNLMRLAESLPPETIAQFDKLLNHKEPSVGPGMDSGIVVAYKSGEVVQDRPMQGNFSKEGIAVYEDGGAVDVGENKSSFTIGDIISRVREEGLPANARAYLRSVFERATGGEPPVFGADYFTDRQLERIRELAEARQRQGYEDVENFAYPDTPSMESYKYYGGPSLPYGLDSLLTDIVDPETILKTSLGGFQIYDEGDHWRINDPFDFTGVKVKGLDTVRHHIVESDNAYSLLRRIAPTLIANEPSRYALDKPSDEWTPRFSFTIPKEGPVREGPGERPPRVKNYEDGGAVEPRPTGFTLSSGRPVWQSGDDLYSEKTITVPYGDGWVNVPTVDVDGSILSEEEVIRLLDQIGPVDIVTGEPLPVFDRLAVAEQKAAQRSVNLSMELKGAAKPRSADPEAEILAIYDLLDKENRKPKRERDPERIEELYSRLTELQAMSPPPVALGLSEDVYLLPQFDASFGIGESNTLVPFFEDTVKIRDRNMGGIARLGAEIGFPGFSGNDRLSGGVTGTYERTKRLFPDEYKPFGYPSDARFGPRGVVPRGYDVSYSSGRHTFSGNVTPRQEGVSRDAPGGRSVYNLGYTYSTPEATFSLQATPFGVRENPDPKTGAAKMVRPFRAGVTIPF